jgi:asparagine synthase (glutamine-hydrolysing)
LRTVPDGVRRWRPLARAQYLEIRTLLSGYLLSSQGDRMLMSNSIEGRFPFLDHRMLELSARLPDALKLKVHARRLLPPIVTEREKFPYRAPVAESLVGARAPRWSTELLARGAVDEVGVFDGAKVEKLIARLSSRSTVPSEADNMALAAVATTQLLARAFDPQRPAPTRGEQVEILRP